MAGLPDWLWKGMQSEGWIVVQSMDTFDVYGGDRFPSRDVALEQALGGSAALASSGEVSLSSEIQGEFFIGQLWRSTKPLESQRGVTLVYSLDSVERHIKLTRGASPAEPVPARSPDSAEDTRPWTCPSCKRTWHVLAEEPAVPQAKAHCPECGKPPSGFMPGQVVRVRESNRNITHLGVIDEPVQAAVPIPGDEHTINDVGPYTGEFMVWHLSHGYGSDIPLDPEAEREIFSSFPLEQERRLRLASHFMTGISASPDVIQALSAEEERLLFGQREAGDA